MVSSYSNHLITSTDPFFSHQAGWQVNALAFHQCGLRSVNVIDRSDGMWSPGWISPRTPVSPTKRDFSYVAIICISVVAVTFIKCNLLVHITFVNFSTCSLIVIMNKETVYFLKTFEFLILVYWLLW